jgi:hypothetical protein
MTDAKHFAALFMNRIRVLFLKKYDLIAWWLICFNSCCITNFSDLHGRPISDHSSFLVMSVMRRAAKQSLIRQAKDATKSVIINFVLDRGAENCGTNSQLRKKNTLIYVQRSMRPSTLRARCSCPFPWS